MSTMNILVTAGNTQVPIDRVRCLTNVFSGRTGTAFALHARQSGHHVTLLTSRPEAILDLQSPPPKERWQLSRYCTFRDLETLMANELKGSNYDALVHSAAVSDYEPAGIFAPAPGTQ